MIATFIMLSLSALNRALLPSDASDITIASDASLANELRSASHASDSGEMRYANSASRLWGR
jgi:hypothetical protein